MKSQHAELVTINGARLEIRERGSGEPVVFVHGMMGEECAAAVIEPALTKRYRVIDYHRRGYGRSEIPDMSVAVAQQVDDLQAILRHLGVAKAHMVGQSYGGVILFLKTSQPSRFYVCRSNFHCVSNAPGRYG